MQKVSSDDDGPLHLGRNDHALQNFATDGYSAGEGALLVDIFSLDGALGGLEAQSDVLEVSDTGAGLLSE